MKTSLPQLTLPAMLTVAGLVGCSVAIWIQWLSGDPAYPKFPPGPIFFIAVAAIVTFAARWWWTPLIGSAFALLVTSGWFAHLPMQMQRLTRPGATGGFPPGIFVGTLGIIVSLFLADVAGLVATVSNYRSRRHAIEGVRMLLRCFGAIFLLMGALVIATGLHTDRYHNLMHMLWGALAFAVSFLGVKTAKYFCIGSGLFYLILAILGLTIGDSGMGERGELARCYCTPETMCFTSCWDVSFWVLGSSPNEDGTCRKIPHNCRSAFQLTSRFAGDPPALRDTTSNTTPMGEALFTA
jgi:hypothetical protein